MAMSPVTDSVLKGELPMDESPVKTVLSNPTFQVVFAVVLGVTAGLTLSELGLASDEAVQVLGFPGQLWLKALKCIVLPMIVFAMIQAMVMLRSLPGARVVGLGVVALYSLTTLMAALEGCLVSVLLLGPLMGDTTPPGATASGEVPELQHLSLLDSVLGIFDGLVPENLVGDAANARFLQVIVASLILGLLIKERDEEGRPSATLKVVGELNEVVVRTISSAATMDFASTGSLIGKFALSVCVGYAVHMLVVYPSLVLLLARRNPMKYMCNVVPAILTALGTSSSAATLPVTTRCSIEGNGIRPHIAKFVLGLGATINMDGTGLWLICSVYFLGVIEGVEFTVGKFMLMSVLAMLCSLGSAPVPNAGLVLLVTMLGSVGVPQTSSFALVVAIDWLLDRGQTVVNVTGDCAVTAVIDRMFGDRCSIEQGEDLVTEDAGADSSSCPSELVV